MATTAPASPEAPRPSKAATTGWLVPAAAAASMSSPSSDRSPGQAPGHQQLRGFQRDQAGTGRGSSLFRNPVLLLKHIIERKETLPARSNGLAARVLAVRP